MRQSDRDYEGPKSEFPHPFWAPYLFGLTIVARKIQNAEIVEKWKNELQGQFETRHFDKVFQYVLRELQWYDEKEQSKAMADGGWKFGPDDKIIYSDSVIDAETKNELTKLGLRLEAAGPKDYHPGSDGLVVDLVHPSLYHLVYGTTKEIVGGKLQTAQYDQKCEELKIGMDSDFASRKYQWLPALMKLDPDSQKFSFVSYINGLHPFEHKELYGTAEKVINRIVAGLNSILGRYSAGEYTRIDIPKFDGVYNDKYAELNEKLDDIIDADLSTDEFEKQYEEILKHRNECALEFPPEWKNGPPEKSFDIKAHGELKVVVKMANIELTPEKPKYAGGTWHVEGTISEDIIATVLYYYDMDNVENSKLSFRVAYGDPQYEQGDEFYCEHYFGLKDGDPMNKYLGSVDAQQDRVILFPNQFQHHVDDFELKDKGKPGRRKILCFFIIDPFNPFVRSTATVPPQQEKWAKNLILMEKYFGDVSSELDGFAEKNTMTWEQALENRKELMAERSQPVSEMDANSRQFSLCEH